MSESLAHIYNLLKLWLDKNEFHTDIKVYPRSPDIDYKFILSQNLHQEDKKNTLEETYRIYNILSDIEIVCSKAQDSISTTELNTLRPFNSDSQIIFDFIQSNKLDAVLITQNYRINYENFTYTYLFYGVIQNQTFVIDIDNRSLKSTIKKCELCVKFKIPYLLISRKDINETSDILTKFLSNLSYYVGSIGLSQVKNFKNLIKNSKCNFMKTIQLEDSKDTLDFIMRYRLPENTVDDINDISKSLGATAENHLDKNKSIAYKNSVVNHYTSSQL